MPGYGTIVEWSPAPYGKPGGIAVVQYGGRWFELVIFWDADNQQFDFDGDTPFHGHHETVRRWLVAEIGIAYPLPLLPPEGGR
jgi:hypothetical protein